MKLLVAPLHYIISETEGSEFTRAFEYMQAIAKDHTYSGDILVAYSSRDHIGNFRIHRFYSKRPTNMYISSKLLFVGWVFYKSLVLMKKNVYDCIWHQGPFAIDETFSLLSLWNKKKIRFVLGPIYTPHTFKWGKDMGYFEKDAKGEIKKISFWKRLDLTLYRYFAKSSSFLSYLTLKNAHKVITIDSIGQEMLRQRKIKHTEVITLSIVSDMFLHKPRVKKGSQFTLLNVSYLIDRKRTVDLLLALDILVNRENMKLLKLVIVGDGPQKSELEQLAEEKNLQKHVNFIGYKPRTEVHNYYLKADMFLSGSISDIMPGMYFEAMAASLPMVLAENITSTELANNKFGGFVVKGRNPQAIADAMKKIINDKELYEKFSKRNFELMQTTYNFDDAITRLKKTFEAK